jgi:hypothetical protein
MHYSMIGFWFVVILRNKTLGFNSLIHFRATISVITTNPECRKALLVDQFPDFRP